LDAPQENRGSRREEKEMRIDPQNPAAGSSGTSRIEDAQAAQVKSSQQTTSTEPNDTVQLSSGAATVRQLVSQLDQVPDIRQGQVNALRSAIGSGEYNPSDAHVAGAIADQSFGISEPG
jgi:flagellar biosynthesis anti-sigma factor FlgM